MTDPVISVERLGKRYRIGLAEKKARNLREALRRLPLAPFRYLQSRLRGPTKEEILWALKDVSFEVKQGEVLGIIGRNGAGKSTLLKILSRITDPTEGRARIRGRVNSLLEVGTGFHPELTGRENIYMNAALHGMKRAEIRGKMDEIIAFAEIDRFIDTPVKRYSSGMYTRLAFAVAAHLEPDILIVDEVLSVGDAGFQRKSLGKMQLVSREGRTVLFVSHNLPLVSTLCNRCALLESGRLVQLGKTSDVVLGYYGGEMPTSASVDFSKKGDGAGDRDVSLHCASIEDESGLVVSEISINEPFRVCLEFDVRTETPLRFLPQFHFVTGSQVHAFATYLAEPAALAPGRYRVECRVPANFLNEGAYFVSPGIASFGAEIKLPCYAEGALSFNVKDPIDGTPDRHGYSGPVPGAVRPRLPWSISRME